MNQVIRKLYFTLGQGMISVILLLSFIQFNYAQSISEIDKNELIKKELSKIVNDGKAVGITAAIISKEGILAIASAGVRKSGTQIPFTDNDQLHLGSCTKAMSATMLATLVGEGKLAWESKLIDVIPEVKKEIHSDYHQITLWQLLTHRAGIFKNPYDWGAFEDKEIVERRLALLIENLKHPSSYPHGEYHYSNFGYMLAACMAERVTGLSWEILMQNRLFDPLGMNSDGFGAPGKPNQIDQPWGHSGSGRDWYPEQDDNPQALGPAGRIHCNLEDWAKFISLFLTDKNNIIDQGLMNKLIEPVGDYAGGWSVAEQSWAKGKVLAHMGTNAIWYSYAYVAPNLNRAYLMATNSCNFGSTFEMLNELVRNLIKIDQGSLNQ